MMNEQKNSNGTNQACASCKYQRRKCQKDCFLAPYFPANRADDFYNVHKLFGVSNVVKILNSVRSEDRATAVETIILQAKARKEDPVHGCMGVMRKLYIQVEEVRKELDIINQQLGYCRQREQQQQQQQQQQLQRQHILAASSSSATTLLQQLAGASLISSYQSNPYLDVSNEIANNLGELKNSMDVGYTFFPNLQEPEDLKPFDVKQNNAVMSLHQHKKIKITNDCKDSDESSVESTARESQAL